MKKLLAIVALIASLGFAVSPVAMAQSTVDVDAVSQAVSDADLDTLLKDLETPPADDELPAGFTNATYVNPETASAEEGVLPSADLAGTAGSVAYSLDWEPVAASASPDASPEASPAGLDSSFAIRFATLNYVFFDQEITADDLEDFRSGAEEGIAGEASPEAGTETNVETIQIDGTDAILLSYVLKDQGVESVVQMVALPVGNCMVIAMLVEASTTVDQQAVQTSAEDLAIAGTDYLGNVAESGQ